MTEKNVVGIPITLPQLVMLIAYAEVGHDMQCGDTCPFRDFIQRTKHWLWKEHADVVASIAFDDHLME